MPKTAVYGNLIETYLKDEDTEPTKVQLVAQIGWTKEGNTVQLGVTGRHPDVASELGIPGHFVDLDWTAVNRLIHELRAARDQAFGKPE